MSEKTNSVSVEKLRLAEVEAAQLAARLRDPGTFAKQLAIAGEDSHVALERLMRRHSELTMELHAAHEFDAKESVRVPGSVARALGALGDLLFPWSTLPLQVPKEKLNQTPGVAGTGGAIETAGLFAGSAAFGAQLYDNGTTSPFVEKWWIHVWESAVTFPPAPTAGTLTWRFSVQGSVVVYSSTVTAGSLRLYATVGDTRDPENTWDNVWPVERLTLETGFPSGDSRIYHSVRVSGGQAVTMKMYFGVIVSAANGNVFLLPSETNISAHLTLPPGTTLGADAFGKLQYRFVPHPVLAP
jgi:hypothetical protein